MIDIAGRHVAVEADDPTDRLHIETFFGGPTTDASEANGSIEVRALPVPDTTPHSTNGPIQRWDDDDRVRLHHADGRRTATVADDSIVLGPVAADDADRWRTIRQLLAEAVSVWLAGHGDLLLHGAVVARDGTSILVLGPTGAGKSSAVVAALASGLQVATDDLAVVRLAPESSPGELLCSGIRKPLMIDRALASHVDAVETTGPLGHDARDRVQLDPDLLTDETTRLSGVVTISHSPGAADIQVTERAATLANVAGSSYEVAHGHIRPVLPVIARVAALPSWTLAHDHDETVRIDRAGELLTRCLEEVTSVQ